MRKLVLMAACGVLAVAAQGARELTPQGRETLKHSLIHRGDGKGRPDNTMEALLYTWAKGYTPESDIRFTKDGKVVAFHDNGLKGRKVSEWTWPELREEDVGSYRGAQWANVPKLDPGETPDARRLETVGFTYGNWLCGDAVDQPHGFEVDYVRIVGR